jgi:uncharacterized pyridoxal phosphate-containing UPF0001 family protein
MNRASAALSALQQGIQNAARQAGRPVPQLLAVSKTQPPEAVAALADAGQRAFGENYVQEALVKIAALAGRGLEWHLIGHLQVEQEPRGGRTFRLGAVAGPGQARRSARPPPSAGTRTT